MAPRSPYRSEVMHLLLGQTDMVTLVAVRTFGHGVMVTDVGGRQRSLPLKVLATVASEGGQFLLQFVHQTFSATAIGKVTHNSNEKTCITTLICVLFIHVKTQMTSNGQMQMTWCHDMLYRQFCALSEKKIIRGDAWCSG